MTDDEAGRQPLGNHNLATRSWQDGMPVKPPTRSYQIETIASRLVLFVNRTIVKFPQKSTKRATPACSHQKNRIYAGLRDDGEPEFDTA